MPNILVLNCDSLTQNLIVLTLSKEGYDVFIPSDFETGVKDLLSKEYDLVVLDLANEDKNNSALINSIRTNQPYIPILTLVKHNPNAKRVDFDEKEIFPNEAIFAESVLQKPICKNDLIKAVQTYLCPSVIKAYRVRHGFEEDIKAT